MLLKRFLILGLAAPLRKLGAILLRRLRLIARVRLQDGLVMRVDLASSVGRSIWLRRIYEPDVKGYLDKVLEVGDAFVDVGAHLGYFSLIGSQAVGPAGEVHSFEPNRETFKLLHDSIELNSLQNVRANCMALWSEKTSLSLSSGRDSGFAHVATSHSEEDPNLLGGISALSLDEYARLWVGRPIKLIKIDVEGAEYLVLLGMQKVLSSHRPRLIMEAQDWSLSRFGSDLNDVFGLLGRFDYRAFDLDEHPLQDVEEARLSLRTQWVKNLIFEPAWPPTH